MTIEDPIEFLHTHKKCLVNQRELGSDAPSFAAALRGALRQDPDVILVGEMRDLETIPTALTAAETGHLVFATLHTQDTPQTIDRIIDVFPPHQQHQVRVQLSVALQGIVTQTLLPTADGSGRCRGLRGADPHARGPQPDPRGQDPPDLLRAPDQRVGTACRRWTPRWPRSCARARSPASSPSSARRPPKSSRACSARTATWRRRHGVATFVFKAIDLAGVRRAARSRPRPSRRSPTSSRQRGLIVLDIDGKAKLEGDQPRVHAARQAARPRGR